MIGRRRRTSKPPPGTLKPACPQIRPGSLALRFPTEVAASAGIVTIPRVIAALCAFLLAPLALADVGMGDSRADVIRATGNPTSHAQRGDREILMYPHGGRVELVDGKVVDVKGPLPAITPAAPGPEKARAPETAPAMPPPPPVTGATAAAPSSKAGPLPATSALAPKTAPGIDALGSRIEKMDTAWGDRPYGPKEPDEFSWLKLAVMTVLHFGITLFALKLAFKIEEMDALWTGVLAIAGVDLAVYVGLEALGPMTGGMTSGNGIEGGLGAIVMIFTIQKFCFTKKLPYAIATAVAVKLIVRLCHIFLFALLLNTLFG
jgi:hypothetical protein